MNEKAFVKHLHAETIRLGGATLDLNGRAAKDGYAVGGQATSLVIPDEIPEHDWEPMIKEWIDRTPMLTVPGYFVGSWLDNETGTLWLDAVKIHSKCETARADALARGELAFYDLTGKREIRLDTVPA